MTQSLLEKVRLPGAGVTIAADVGGPDDGTPVIMLHGIGQTRHSWGKAAARLAASGYRVTSFDLRGHGESDWSPDSVYGFERFMADLAAVQALQTRPAFLVGASMGGLTALLAVGEAEAQAAGLVLVDIAPRMEQAGANHITSFMRGNAEGFASVEEAADTVAAYRPGRPRPRDPSGLLKNLRLGADGRYYWHWDPAIMQHRRTPEGWEKMLARFRAAASALTVPTALVRGGLSNVVSAEGADEFAGLVPHAEIVTIDQADHMVAGDRNDRFADAVTAFLDRHAAA